MGGRGLVSLLLVQFCHWVPSIQARMPLLFSLHKWRPYMSTHLCGEHCVPRDGSGTLELRRSPHGVRYSKNISALARISHVGPYVRTGMLLRKGISGRGRECRIRSGAPPPPEILDCLSLASYHMQ